MSFKVAVRNVEISLNLAYGKDLLSAISDQNKEGTVNYFV